MQQTRKGPECIMTSFKVGRIDLCCRIQEPIQRKHRAARASVNAASANCVIPLSRGRIKIGENWDLVRRRYLVELLLPGSVLKEYGEVESREETHASTYNKRCLMVNFYRCYIREISEVATLVCTHREGNKMGLELRCEEAFQQSGRVLSENRSDSLPGLEESLLIEADAAVRE